jgi:hypothetical protein
MSWRDIHWTHYATYLMSAAAIVISLYVIIWGK